jgi:DNA repair protein RecO (recombination protein O)
MQTKALILKKQPAKEFDQLITCYSQELGKFTAVAKSSLKPNSIQGMHLDAMNLVDFDLINGRATPIITGAHMLESFSSIRNSLPLTAAAYFFLEVVDRVAYDHQVDIDLWEFLLATFQELNTIEESELSALFHTRQQRFLEVLGYASNATGVASATVMSPQSVFEYTFGRQFASLKFLEQVL